MLTVPSRNWYGPSDELVMRPLVEQAGIAATVRDQALQSPRDGNDYPAAFSVLSAHRVIDIHV
jgi:hypothetical protein